VGGHVDEADADGRTNRAAYDMALARELEEEVEVASPGQLRLVGLINDDDTPVGRVHLGVVHEYVLERAAVRPRESGLADSGFTDLDEVRRSRERFETWSQICLDGFLFGRQ
jgi:predicted NUDIX family phosphoesterase